MSETALQPSHSPSAKSLLCRTRMKRRRKKPIEFKGKNNCTNRQARIFSVLTSSGKKTNQQNKTRDGKKNSAINKSVTGDTEKRTLKISCY